MRSFMERPNIIAQYIFAYNFHTSTDSYFSPTPHLGSMKEQASSLKSLHRGNLWEGKNVSFFLKEIVWAGYEN